MTSRLATDSGLGSIVEAVVSANSLRYIGLGNGSGQNETATDLASPFSEARTAGTLMAATTNTANDTVRLTGTVAAAVTHSVTEMGVFDSSIGGDMGIYGDFPMISLAVGDTISFTIDVVLDQA